MGCGEVGWGGVGWGGLITSMYACGTTSCYVDVTFLHACTSTQCYVDVTFLRACTSTQCYVDVTSMHRGVATLGPPHIYIYIHIWLCFFYLCRF